MGGFTNFLKKRLEDAKDAVDVLPGNPLVDVPATVFGGPLGAMYAGYNQRGDIASLAARGTRGLIGLGQDHNIPGANFVQQGTDFPINMAIGGNNAFNTATQAATPSGVLQAIEQRNPAPLVNTVQGIPGVVENVGSAFGQGFNNAAQVATHGWIPDTLQAAATLAGDPSISNALNFGLNAAAPSLALANTPVEAIHTEQGEGAYYAATHSGAIRDVDAASPFNYAVEWARNNPAEWPNIQKIYLNGYDSDGDGVADFGPGPRAVWEYYIGKQSQSTRVATDITNDPWNLLLLTPTAEMAAGKASAALAERAPAAARGIEVGGNLIGRTEQGINAVMDLPYVGPAKALRAAVRKIPGEAAIERALFDESKRSLAGRTADEAVDQLHGVSSQNVTPNAAPAWATPQTPTGKYEAVEAPPAPDGTRGRSYVVDPNGNPVPISMQEGKGAKKRARAAADAWNSSANPPTGVAPDQSPPIAPYEQQWVTNYNPPEDASIITQEGVDQGATDLGVTYNQDLFTQDRNVPLRADETYRVVRPGTGTTSDFPTAGPYRREDLERGWVEGNANPNMPPGGTTPFPPDPNGFTPFPPDNGTTPAIYQQTQAQRREAINQGMTQMSPNIGDRRISTVVEQARAHNPHAADNYARAIGFDWTTGQAVPGGAIDRMQRRIDAIPFWGDGEGGLAAKAIDQRLFNSDFVIHTQAPAVEQAFKVRQRPGLPSNSEGPIADMAAKLLSQNPTDMANGATQLIGRAIFGNDVDSQAALDVLTDFAKDHPWIEPRLDRAIDLGNEFASRWDANAPIPPTANLGPFDMPAPVEPPGVKATMSGTPVEPEPARTYPMPSQIGVMPPNVAAMRPTPKPFTPEWRAAEEARRAANEPLTPYGQWLAEQPAPVEASRLRPANERTRTIRDLGRRQDVPGYADDPFDPANRGPLPPGTEVVVRDDGYHIRDIPPEPTPGSRELPEEYRDLGFIPQPKQPRPEPAPQPASRRVDFTPTVYQDIELDNGVLFQKAGKGNSRFVTPDGDTWEINSKGSDRERMVTRTKPDGSTEVMFMSGPPQIIAEEMARSYSPGFNPGETGPFGRTKDVDLGNGFTAKANRTRKGSAPKKDPVWWVEDRYGNVVDSHKPLDAVERNAEKGRYTHGQPPEEPPAAAPAQPNPEPPTQPAPASVAPEPAAAKPLSVEEIRNQSEAYVHPEGSSIILNRPSAAAPGQWELYDTETGKMSKPKSKAEIEADLRQEGYVRHNAGKPDTAPVRNTITDGEQVTAHPVESADAAVKLAGRTGDTGVVVVPTDAISTDPARFQPREGLDMDRVQNIAEAWDVQRLDPPVVWRDPANGKVYVLAGHHRLEAARTVGAAEIPVREFRGTEQQAMDFAHTSNNQKAQSALEQAGVARRLRNAGESIRSIRQKMNLSSDAMAQKYINASYAPQTVKEYMKIPVDQGGASLNLAAALGRPVAEGSASVDEMARLFDYFVKEGKLPTPERVENFMAVAEIRNKAIANGEIDPYGKATAPTLFDMTGLNGGGIIGDAIRDIEEMGAKQRVLATQRAQLIGASRKSTRTGITVGEADAVTRQIEDKLDELQRQIEGYSVRNAFGVAQPKVVDTPIGKAYEMPGMPQEELTLRAQEIPEEAPAELTPEQQRAAQLAAGQTDMFGNTLGITSNPTPAAQRHWNRISGGPAEAIVAPPQPMGDSIIDQLVRDAVIPQSQAAKLRETLPGLEGKTLFDTYLDHLSYGMTEQEARAAIRDKIYKSINPDRVLRQGKGFRNRSIRITQQTWAAMGKAADFARQSMMYNMFNGVAGSIGDTMGNTSQLYASGRHAAANRQMDAIRFAMGGEPMMANVFSKENSSVLNAWGRDMPEAIIPRSGQPITLRTGFADTSLTAWDAAEAMRKWAGLKEIPGPFKAMLSVVQNPRARLTRQGIDAASKGALFETVLDDQADELARRMKQSFADAGLPPEETLAAVQARAKMRQPAQYQYATPTAFSPEDVIAVTGNKRLGQAVAEFRNEAYRNAADETRRVLFAGGKRYNIDDAIAHVFFFHYWQTRSLALQVRNMLRNPRIMGQYYRMIQGAMHEADEKGYPPTFRGLTHYWGDTAAGWYGLFNPLGVIVPAMMFSDLANVRNESGQWEKISSLLPVSPIVQGAVSALGYSDQTPYMGGTARVQNVVSDVMSWGNAHGFDFTQGLTGGGPVDDPVQAMTRKVIGWINTAITATGAGQRFEPYVPLTGKIDTIRAVVLHNAQQQYGPMEQWTPEQTADVQDALLAVESGGAGNPLAENAFKSWADANLRNRLASFVLPQGSVLRYGPREVDRNLAKTDEPGAEMAQTRNNLRVASDAAMPLEIGKFQQGQIGTPEQKALADGWADIRYGRIPTDGSPAPSYTIRGQTFTLDQIAGMPDDDRKLLADAWVADQGGTASLEAYREATNTFKEGNASLANYDQYTQTVGSFTGGAGGFRAWAREVSPEFKRREAIAKQRARSRGASGAALEAEMDGWARSQDAYLAFQNKRKTIYDAQPAGSVTDPTTTLMTTQALIDQLNGSSNYGNKPGLNGPLLPGPMTRRVPWVGS